MEQTTRLTGGYDFFNNEGLTVTDANESMAAAVTVDQPAAQMKVVYHLYNPNIPGGVQLPTECF